MTAGHGFAFDTVIDRSETASLKWERYRGRDIIPLWVADMDFQSPPAVLAALRERVDHGVFGYTTPPQALEATVLAMLEEEYGWRVAEDWLVWLPGLVCGLNVACRAVGEPDDEVLTFTPVYPPFLTAPANSRRAIVKVPLRLAAGRWEADLAELELAITSRTRLLLLCNPHNPVGRVWTAAELSDIANLAERRDLIICADEIHAGLILDEEKRHIPIATLSPDTARRTITLHAPSKSYNIPGLGCSFAVIADPGLRLRFLQVMAGIVPHVTTFGYTAALAAYRHGEAWRRELLVYLRGNRELVETGVGRMPGLTMGHVEATYLAWIDARQTGVEWPARFFEEAGVGLSDGADFDAPGFVRLNFGCPRPLLAEALRRMAAAVGG
jgi:cystathionine beta-lyase